jgi:integral membrane protein (TIGR01906 family)
VHTLTTRLGSLVIGLATAIVILAVAIPLFLNPWWVGFEQGRAQAAAWTGYPDAVLRDVTDSVLADLVIGPPDFDVAVDGAPVLDARERSHMRDVRTVFAGFFALAAILGVAALIVAWRRRRSAALRRASWEAVLGGAVGLIAALVIGGVIAFVAFDTLFEVFHQLLFPGGSYDFDPSTEKLVQLFPFVFWQETAIAVGAVAIAIAVVVALVAYRRSTAAATAEAGDGRMGGVGAPAA